MKQIKVLFVQTLLSPYVKSRLEILAKNSALSITLLVDRKELSSRPGWSLNSIPNITIESLESPTITPYRKFKDLAYDIKYIRTIPWKLPLALWRHKPDIVVLCNATHLLFSLVPRIAAGFKIALMVEDTPHSTRNHGKYSKLIKTLLYKSANFYFSYSEMSTRFLKTIGIENSIYRTSWSIEPNNFEPNKVTRSQFRKKHYITDKIAFLFVGALIPGKGICQLINAWSQLPIKKRKNATLLIVGSGEEEDKIKEIIQDKNLSEVVVLGQLPYTEMKKTYAGCDIFILPTLQDLFSLVVLEAMACGCPVITTPYNGASELIEENKTGWLFDINQPIETLTVLKKAIDKSNILSTMGRNACKRVSKMDNYTVMSEFVNSLLNEANNFKRATFKTRGKND